jgi:hypothetical protein
MLLKLLKSTMERIHVNFQKTKFLLENIVSITEISASKHPCIYIYKQARVSASSKRAIKFISLNIFHRIPAFPGCLFSHANSTLILPS